MKPRRILDSDPWLTVADVAERLGYRSSRGALHYLRSLDVPMVWRGHALLVRESVLNAAIEDRNASGGLTERTSHLRRAS